MVQRLQGEALAVHIFVATDGPAKEADHAYLREVWQRCIDRLEMTERLADLPTAPDLTSSTSLLAGCRRPQGVDSPNVQEALLRRVHDTFWLTVMREPAGATWAELDGEWEQATTGLNASEGVFGTARLYLARVVGSDQPEPVALTDVVKACLPQSVPAAAQWWDRGVRVPPGFSVWEASAPSDGRRSRAVVVVAAADADAALSGWTWVTSGRQLPRFGRYLLNAAKLHHQQRVWEQEHPTLRRARRVADATVDRLMEQVLDGDPPDPSGLVAVSRDVVGLQRGEVGLARAGARLREMRRTVEIATANLTALAGPAAPGLFAEDRELGAWLGRQLEDDEVYLNAARERAEQMATLTDQMIRRGLEDDQARRQGRQDRFNLGLTGVIGAILMMLTAIQSLMYKPPLPPLVIPAVVAALSALALLASLLVLRVAVPHRRWSQALVLLGSGLVGSTAAWIVVSAIVAAPDDESRTRFWAAIGFIVGVAVGAVLTPRE